MTHEKEQKKQQELYRDEVTRKRFTDQLKEKEKQQDIINKKNVMRRKGFVQESATPFSDC